MASYSNEELEELAKQPNNIVYQVKYDDVDYTPMSEVKKLLGIVRGLAAVLRKEHEDWSDDQIRDEISLRSAAARKMREKTHPRLFLKITDRNLTDEDAEAISYMISLYERKEQGKLSQEDVETATYVNILKSAGV